MRNQLEELAINVQRRQLVQRRTLMFTRGARSWTRSTSWLGAGRLVALMPHPTRGSAATASTPPTRRLHPRPNTQNVARPDRSRAPTAA